MKRKLLIEESDSSYEPGRADSFVSGLEQGFRTGGYFILLVFLIFIIVLMLI
jgi:hypothetical protein